MASSLGPRLERELEDHPLLLAAARTFVRIGYEASTVQDILDEAGVSRRTFYKKYRGKEEALIELHRIASEVFLGALEAAVSADGDPEEKLGRLVDTFFLSAKAAAGLILQLRGNATRPDSPLAPRRRASMLRIATMMQQHVDQSLAPLDWLALFASIDAVTRGMVTQGNVGDEAEGRAKDAFVRMYRGLRG